MSRRPSSARVAQADQAPPVADTASASEPESPPESSPAFSELLERIAALMLPDQRRLGRRLEGVRRVRKPSARAQALTEIGRSVDEAEARVEERRAAVPKITYPEALPVSRRKDEIAAAIRDHQVVIVAGETGSGKTTQLPKICLELGRGVTGLIAHTQPRRIAARTVAQRVADELGTQLGEAVGWKVRFTDQVGDRTLVKLMTDGILLAEIQQDRDLRQYDTIIIDEAHERSLNIDFLLGYLAQLLPRRPELKVVITSATIDPERFARHFRSQDGEPAPVVEVSGRTYPVEVRYRPLLEEGGEEGDGADRDQVTAICEAVDELQAEGPGDVLVFLSGEREIRDTADALGKRQLRHTEILPLYARLSHGEQQRVFQRHSGRRVVLATNVAETSLTVPGIKYVIDPGNARISRYSHRTKVQRLPIEAISQASANQRKGRCGRTSDGICVRLYSEDDFESRPEFTDPEIVRTNLASVVLQMISARLGEIEKFPFIDPPDHRSVRAGVQLLEELHALEDNGKRLTETGRRLAQLPVDPRLARMVLEADRNGCAREVMVIAAALSVQDPRERPAEKQQAADEKHRRFREGPGEESDFLALLQLWEYVRERQRELSSSAFRRMCRTEFLNYLRIREWQDIYAQLRSVGRSLGIQLAEEGAEPQPDRIHQSLLAGLLSQLGLKDTDKHEYLGARGAKFAVFPGSVLFKKPPRWVMSAELVETSRLWARVNARIDPEWIEPLAGHLVKRTYSEPHWEQKQAAVMAYERVTLYGVPVVAQRKVNYGRIDPEVSRDLFIRHALVEGDWRTQHAFFKENRALLAEVEELEHRARRRDILVDDETLYAFYDRHVPEFVVSGAHFDSWWKKRRSEEPDLLSFEKSMLINEAARAVTESDYPDTWRQGRLSFAVTYQFEPGADADGVTVHLPLQVLNQVSDEGFDWQIPGVREQLTTELIRSLPKPLRRHCVPAPDFARRFLATAPEPGSEPLVRALARELRRLTGQPLTEEDFDLAKVPDHLRVTFRAVDDRGRRPAGDPKQSEDKDLPALRQRMRPKAREAVDQAFSTPSRGKGGGRRRAGEPQPGAESGGVGPEQRSGLTDWTVGTLPRTVETRRGGQPVRAFPALVDEGASVAVRLFDSQEEQTEAMARGTRRLVLLRLPSDPAKFAAGQLDNRAKLTLASSPHGSVAALLSDCATAAVDQLVAAHGGPAWDEASFRKLVEAVRADVVPLTERTVTRVREVLAAWQSCERRLKGVTSPVLLESLADVRGQLAALMCPGFVTAHGARRLPDLLRYLTAVERRLQQLPQHAQRDLARTAKVREMADEYAWLLEQFPTGTPVPAAAREIRWMIEELRVSFFAHALGTAYPISEKRIVKAVDAAVPEGAR
ncbi:ATP-dependent RNA helicase HrpA [Streptomyces sp. ventii]|uniref:ATP-dependent RNA helicase HrpA n=2 Tax=Streptomyces spiramenti TaxID=2720606 RepID=A0ABX1ASP5_9ACTN|nr:ATP-dependent RNA helicase HrpA [Streptomyces spiramenti]NJP68085.1 ATP-dependent RNA helicase HrpA [Streptomyces spiramenti]